MSVECDNYDSDECRPAGTCDWGDCDEEVEDWRWSDDVHAWLPVCQRHRA